VKKSLKKYSHAVIATDVAIFTVREGALQVLLIKMKKEPYRRSWALPGGLIQGTETADQAARRHLGTKAGVRKAYLEQLYTFSRVNRDPFGRVVSVAYIALIPSDNLLLTTTDEYADVRWFPVADLPPLAYDHREIIEYAIRRLAAKLEYTNIASSLLPAEFTLQELQQIYETILGRPLDKRNFRKKLLSLAILKGVSGKKTTGAHRPAQLYAFVSRTPHAVQILAP
jgi:8-oxo-dGTP diphosphatase